MLNRHFLLNNMKNLLTCLLTGLSKQFFQLKDTICLLQIQNLKEKQFVLWKTNQIVQQPITVSRATLKILDLSYCPLVFRSISGWEMYLKWVLMLV